ncbi:hypothetical protein AMECASPLE_013872 [Ameca splendens]|uniref:Uncharacterized protein n=1 Tax=Ameca splendens TaxID=208324 RepID=A0ABV0XQH7_9TELE
MQSLHSILRRSSRTEEMVKYLHTVNYSEALPSAPRLVGAFTNSTNKQRLRCRSLFLSPFRRRESHHCFCIFFKKCSFKREVLQGRAACGPITTVHYPG